MWYVKTSRGSGAGSASTKSTIQSGCMCTDGPTSNGRCPSSGQRLASSAPTAATRAAASAGCKMFWFSLPVHSGAGVESRCPRPAPRRPASSFCRAQRQTGEGVAAAAPCKRRGRRSAIERRASRRLSPARSGSSRASVARLRTQAWRTFIRRRRRAESAAPGILRDPCVPQRRESRPSAAA